MSTRKPAQAPARSRFQPGIIVLSLLFIGIALLLSACASEQSTPFNEVDVPALIHTAEPSLPECIRPLSSEIATVMEVIDGDTITVALDGRVETIRYLGIDAPEMKASDPYFGRLAKQRNRSLVAGEEVTLYRGNTDSDDFGRLLRFVFVEDTFVNQYLVEQGLATSFNRPHDAVCAELFTEAMLGAYHARIGIWEGIDKVYRDGPALCPNGCEDHPRGCNIKGNITAQDDYIYHVPSSPDYPDVKIQPEKGERWFCTLEEALNMGWRPPRQE